jgi:hypothetical protein
MSRSVKCNGYDLFRNPRTQRTRLEHYASLELSENGYGVPNRLRGRSNLTGSIPTAYDDLSYSVASPHHLDRR